MKVKEAALLVEDLVERNCRRDGFVTGFNEVEELLGGDHDLALTVCADMVKDDRIRISCLIVDMLNDNTAVTKCDTAALESVLANVQRTHGDVDTDRFGVAIQVEPSPMRAYFVGLRHAQNHTKER